MRSLVFTCRHAPVALAPEILDELATHYGEPHRAYHDVAHVGEVLHWYDVITDEVGWQEPLDIYHAILFHDVIYDPKAPSGQNESRSAELARKHGVSERGAELILLTAKHGKLGPGDVDQDAALFLDSDTAILGASRLEFDAYDAAIAHEYAHLPPDVYRAGRRTFLEGMLARPRLFLSDFFHARLDAAARANLTRVLGH
jgi:predicted metal-dependent HD superfamily phosphohydrolase